MFYLRSECLMCFFPFPNVSRKETQVVHTKGFHFEILKYSFLMGVKLMPGLPNLAYASAHGS